MVHVYIVYTWLFISIIIIILNPVTISGAKSCHSEADEAAIIGRWERQSRAQAVRKAGRSTLGLPQPTTSCRLNPQRVGRENVCPSCKERGLYENECSSETAETGKNALKFSLKTHINTEGRHFSGKTRSWEG